MRTILSVLTLGLVVIALVVGQAAIPTRAADHLDAPLVDIDGRVDITDIYAYTHGSNTVLIMNVDPLAGVVSPTSFRSRTHYDFRIDNTGDARVDITYRVEFQPRASNGTQAVTLKMLTGTAAQTDQGGTLVASGRTGSTIAVSGGGSLWAGLRDDPFFFDLAAFKMFSADHNTADFCNPGSDFFKGANVASIVLEVPTAPLLGSAGAVIYPWGTVSVLSELGVWQEVERMGKPALATVFIKPVDGQAYSDLYNASQPSDDLKLWGPFFPDNAIPLLGGISVRNLLLPDTLILNTAGPLVLNNISFAGYPNGRRLDDDVIDTSFGVLANAGVLPSNVTTDCVANDSTFSTTFPYLAPPNP